MKRALHAVLLSAVAWLQMTAGVHAAPPKPKPPVKVVYIAIVSVDPAAMTITVAARNSMSTEAKTYKVTPATVIKVGGTPGALADLKPEMAVHFELLPDGVTATELSASKPPTGS